MLDTATPGYFVHRSWAGPSYVDQNGVPVVNQKCVRWHSLETQYLRLTSREAFDRLSPELRLRAGDLLWNSTGTGTIGRAVVYDGSLKELTADSHVTIVRPVQIEPKFLGYFVETGRVQHLVEEGHVGSTNQRELPRAFVEELAFPLAPLPEQRRIVERIDALFAEIADGEAALETARKGLETFRRALLKAAVTGDLTRDWRETQKPAETGHDLLARIRAERAATPARDAAKALPQRRRSTPRICRIYRKAGLGQVLRSSLLLGQQMATRQRRAQTALELFRSS